MCEGLFFRGRDSSYHDGRGHFVQHREMSFLKRKSCKGCRECSWKLEFLREDAHQLVLPNEIQDGALYKLAFNVSKGVGYMDSGDDPEIWYEFVKVEETK